MVLIIPLFGLSLKSRKKRTAAGPESHPLSYISSLVKSSAEEGHDQNQLECVLGIIYSTPDEIRGMQMAWPRGTCTGYKDR